MCYNYRVTTGRNLDFCKRHGLWLLSSNRYIPGDARVYYEEHFSDAVICLGNEYVMKQFLKEEDDIGKYRFQHAFFFPVTEPQQGPPLPSHYKIPWAGFKICFCDCLYNARLIMAHRDVEV